MDPEKAEMRNSEMWLAGEKSESCVRKSGTREV